MKAKTLLTGREVAKLLLCSEDSVRSYSSRGLVIDGQTFRLTRYGSRHLRRYDLDEVRGILAAWEQHERITVGGGDAPGSVNE